MEFLEYQKLAARTEKQLPLAGRLQHGMLGIITEAGELGDTIKKHVIYGKTLDLANIDEELGDLMWYMAVIANAVGSDFERIAIENIAKLRARYPADYSDVDALERKDKAE